jgi:hypothetical protein
MPGKLHYDFGLISGNNIKADEPSSGLNDLESANFKVLGDFRGVTTAEVLQRAVVRFHGEWAGHAQSCLFTLPGGEGIRGSVATVPR